MKRQSLASLLAALMLTFLMTAGVAAADNDGDTDARLVQAKVLEVTDGHISVIARSGVEHVIAVDSSGTKVKVEGKLVSLKDLRKGDVITVELDELNPCKFAKNIAISVQADSQLAKTEP